MFIAGGGDFRMAEPSDDEFDTGLDPNVRNATCSE